jgi:uncharacterized protein YcaQ
MPLDLARRHASRIHRNDFVVEARPACLPFYAAPQLRREMPGAIQRAKTRLLNTRIDGIDWYWPPNGNADRQAPQDTVRLLSPFDPVVWDRARFDLLWGWVSGVNYFFGSH